MQKPEIISEEVLLQSKYFKVTKKTFKRGGRTFSKEFVERTAVVYVVPFTKDGKIILEKQYRDAFNDVLTEVVAGHIEEDGDPLETAKRELQEEVGFTASKWHTIGTYEIAANMRQTIHVFAATDLTKGEASPDIDEQIESVSYSITEVKEMIASGQIIIASHIAALQLCIEKFEQKAL